MRKTLVIEDDVIQAVQDYADANCRNKNFTMAADIIFRAGLKVVNRVYEDTEKRGELK